MCGADTDDAEEEEAVHEEEEAVMGRRGET